MTFEQWLADESERSATLKPALGSGNKAELRRRVNAVLRRNEWYFRLALLLAVLLAICTAVTAFLAHTASVSPWRPAMFGVSTFGAVVFVARTVREKFAFEIMVELAAGLDEAGIRDVVKVLSRKFATSSWRGGGAPITPD